MLPKVATHILHHTSRAVAVVQNQTGHTIRNVLQLQSSSGPSSTAVGPWNGSPSSSGWNPNGSGPGGAKYSGSRFYAGYNGAGRAVTAADPSFSNSGISHPDDSDDRQHRALILPTRLGDRDRARSSSLSSDRRERADKLAVLKAVQLYARAQHTLSQQVAVSDAPELLMMNTSNKPEFGLDELSAISADDIEASHDEGPPLAELVAAVVERPTMVESSWEVVRRLEEARSSGESTRVLLELEALRRSGARLDVKAYNVGLKALCELREAGQSLRPVLETYNAMISEGVRPDLWTYYMLVMALTDRDHEVQGAIKGLKKWAIDAELMGTTNTSAYHANAKRLAGLREENNFDSAMLLFEAASKLSRTDMVSLHVYMNMLRSCAEHGNVEYALRVYGHLEKCNKSFKPPAVVFMYLIATYARVKDLQGAKEVFEEFQRACTAGRIQWVDAEAQSDGFHGSLSASIMIYNRMIDAHFACGNPAGALELLEKMMDTPVTESFDPTSVPPPSSSTFGRIVLGFAANDIQTAIAWFEKLLQQKEPPPQNGFAPTPTPTRPDGYAWDWMLDALLDRKMFEEFDRFWAQYEQLKLTDQLSRGLGRFAYKREAMQPRLTPVQERAEETQAAAESPPPPAIRIDGRLSAAVDAHLRAGAFSPLDAYKRLNVGIRVGAYPHAEVFGRLITALGRLHEMEKARFLYEAVQPVLADMANDKEHQSQAWFFIEDCMVVANAHAGDLPAAHLHRSRILEHGGAPSADAYGALIQHVKDTTDDTSNAMALWQESQAHAVTPNVFLFNTIISKLAKARKADSALELFRQMYMLGIQPTSVTYGAVIAACCRVGDVQAAETLFTEMIAQSNFRPRVPPFNTMMQLYTQTKPDRARVLHFYGQLRSAKVPPTAHTYKLLLDAYGAIEPVDTVAMENVFKQLIDDGTVPVQGTHWAALINSYGCVQKNVEKAIQIFESIATHPTTRSSGAALPDAVTVEALINVLVTQRRMDLIPQYREWLSSHNVHMTAYIANLLIKGYAAVGDIWRAREIFEALVDPPEGVAAPNNHTPHDGESVSVRQVPVDAPVFREPSTWEAMVRAELGNGNRDEAVALLERIQARNYPEAVYNRISGIMLDDSVSPWPSPESGSTISSP